MSLKKYYNYFKENLKKSKGILMVFFGLVPLITIVMLIMCLIGKVEFLEFNVISIPILILMYLAPIILAVSLFGFVFHKNSVDFVMSKPISRKNIFLSNVLGGILFLVIFMLINSLILVLFSLFTTLVLPLGLIFDYFLFWLISYIFVFVITVLAISFTGNMATSIVVILIIICLYPYLVYSMSVFDSNYYAYIKCDSSTCAPTEYYCYDDTECEEHLEDGEYIIYLSKVMAYNFTTPVKALNMESTYYSVSGIIKMVILSLIYTIAAYFIFLKRPMEDNEISFKKDWVHYVVKSITFIPVCFIAFLFMVLMSYGFIIAIVGAFIYYLLYDIITRKGVYKFGKSLSIFLITFGVFTGTYYICYKISDKDIESTVYSDIESLYFTNYDITITDSDTINDLLKSTLSDTYSGTYYSAIATIDGSEYYLDIYYDTTTNETIKEMAQNSSKEKLNNYDYSKVDYISFDGTRIPLSDELISLLESDKSSASTMSSISLELYTYTNHDYEIVNFYVSSKELYEYIMEYKKLEIIEALNDSKSNPYFYIYFGDSQADGLNEYIADYVINSNLASFIKYIETDTITLSDDYLTIEIYTDYDYYSYIISDIDAFMNEFNTYKERLASNQEYLDMINNFYEIFGEDYEY